MFPELVSSFSAGYVPGQFPGQGKLRLLAGTILEGGTSESMSNMTFTANQCELSGHKRRNTHPWSSSKSTGSRSTLANIEMLRFSSSYDGCI